MLKAVDLGLGRHASALPTTGLHQASKVSS